MSVDFDLFWLTLSFRMPHAVELSVQIGVAGCLWLNSFEALMSGTACVTFMKRAAISASAALEHTFFMSFAITATDPLSLVPLSLERQWNPPALLQASDATRHAASEWMLRIMSLALCVCICAQSMQINGGKAGASRVLYISCAALLRLSCFCVLLSVMRVEVICNARAIKVDT